MNNGQPESDEDRNVFDKATTLLIRLTICSTALDELELLKGSGEKLAQDNQVALDKINKLIDQLKEQIVLATIHTMGEYKIVIGSAMRKKQLHTIGIPARHQPFWLITATPWLLRKN